MHEHLLPGWKCEKCGSRNEEATVTCCLCETPRPGTESYADLVFEDTEHDTGVEISSG